MYKRTYMSTAEQLDIVTPDGRLLIEEIEVEVKYGGSSINHNGKVYISLLESEISAVTV